MHRDARVLQRLGQPGQGGIGDRGVDQQRLGGVAHAGPARLGVEQDAFGHIEIGRLMHVDMAIADTGLDGGHHRVAHHRVDQACSAARDHDVDEAAGLDQMGDAGAVRAGKQLHGVGFESLGGQRCRAVR